MSELNSLLFVEDNQFDVELGVRALQSFPLANQIVVVGQGEEALDFLHRRGNFHNRPTGDPVMILLDLRLPGMDGLELLHELKANPLLCHIPVVVMAVSHDDLLLEKSHQLGVTAYILKPLTFPQLAHAAKVVGLTWGLLPGSSALVEKAATKKWLNRHR